MTIADYGSNDTGGLFGSLEPSTLPHSLNSTNSQVVVFTIVFFRSLARNHLTIRKVNMDRPEKQEKEGRGRGEGRGSWKTGREMCK